MGEWIEHDGKGAPDLPKGTLVLTKRPIGDGRFWTDRYASTIEWWDGPGGSESNWFWPDGEPSPHRIVAYRVALSPSQTQPE